MRDGVDARAPDAKRARSRRAVAVAELYCGLGAMHGALTRLRDVDARVTVAVDVNPHAAATYAVNHGARPLERNLVSASVGELLGARAEAWLMSPPCQPFTRNGSRLDVEDGRSESFVRLVEVLREAAVEVRPRYVFVENVVGFEKSRMREALMEALRATGFHAQEFVLTPTMFGVPYSRPRYFLCARSTSAFEDAVEEIRREPPPSALSHKRHWIPNYDESADAALDVAPLSRFLDSDDSDDVWREHALKQEDVDRAKGCLDIVTGSDACCNCFTKSYFKYVKGTGSVVANRPVDKSTWDGRLSVDAEGTRLRYFTVDEVARLHSFSSDFKWPENLTKRQKYTLLGNSMSIACVAPLLDYLFHEKTEVA